MITIQLLCNRCGDRIEDSIECNEDRPGLSFDALRKISFRLGWFRMRKQPWPAAELGDYCPTCVAAMRQLRTIAQSEKHKPPADA
jgi:hypothetical protein